MHAMRHLSGTESRLSQIAMHALLADTAPRLKQKVSASGMALTSLAHQFAAS